jgi:uncharacterized membrane protein YcaP (DUF421 family)
MESVLRAALVYLVLFLILRVSGKRTLKETTPFGAVLLFLIGSAVADAMKDEDRSITNGFLIVTTLVLMHIIFSKIKWMSRRGEKLLDDVPTILVKDGELLEERMKNARVTTNDILASGRKEKLKEINDIKYAILEVDGSICIIPKEKEQ